MYWVALVQNQSEMAHYSYADARPLLDGYAYRLFTGDNIAELGPALARRQVNALVLGSNALNDKDILQALNHPDFRLVLAEFLAAGGGFLGLQQIGLAMRKGPPLGILPEPYGRLRPVVVPRDDIALRSGQLAFAAPTAPHVALVYPNEVVPERVREHALGFRSLPGLYWHFWEDVDLSEWDQLIIDPSADRVRSLVLAVKESSPARIIVSALPLDWQDQTDFFRNLLIYVVEGRHNLATVDPVAGEDEFNYLRETLDARMLPFGRYTLPADLDAVVRNVRLGIHSTLLVGSGLQLDDLPPVLLDAVGKAVRGGRLRVIDLGQQAFGVRSMSVFSQELRPRRLLRATELQIQAELREGYIDDSFWSHVETLQTIERLPDRDLDYGRLQEAAWTITRNHDRAGSYDEIFGPTCAYYWLRARYLGPDSTEALETAAWLRRAFPAYEPTDRALAYTVLADRGQLAEAERADLIAVVQGLTLDDLSESELLQYLRAVLNAAPSPDLVVPLITALIGRQRDGVWIDLTTTATATNAVLDAYAVLAPLPAHAAVVKHLERCARASIVFILRGLARSEASAQAHPYPWDGKARTTTKCLQAWMKFDALQDLPVFELLESLGRVDDAASRAAGTRTALMVLQETSLENARLRAQNVDLRSSLARADARARVWSAALIGATVFAYLITTLFIGLLIFSDWAIGNAAKIGFIQGWGFQSGLAGLIFGAVGFFTTIRRRRQTTQDDS